VVVWFACSTRLPVQCGQYVFSAKGMTFLAKSMTLVFSPSLHRNSRFPPPVSELVYGLSYGSFLRIFSTELSADFTTHFSTNFTPHFSTNFTPHFATELLCANIVLRTSLRTFLRTLLRAFLRGFSAHFPPLSRTFLRVFRTFHALSSTL
jgi:hypothetical protein